MKIKTFLDNAFLFYQKAPRILSDSRMAFAPVPCKNGLGELGTRRPTLGVFVEWWLDCEVDLTKDCNANDALTYHFVGNPWTGTNRCWCVYPDGQTAGFSHSSFSALVSSFMNIHRRYAEMECDQEAYSLDEVVSILKAEGHSRESELASQLLIEKRRKNVLQGRYDKLMAEHMALEDKYQQCVMDCHREELEEFRTEYMRRKEQADEKARELDNQRAAYRSQMKQGLITNVEYQHLFAPLVKQKQEILGEVQRFKMDRIKELSAKGSLTDQIVWRYLREGAQSGMTEEQQMAVNCSY